MTARKNRISPSGPSKSLAPSNTYPNGLDGAFTVPGYLPGEELEVFVNNETGSDETGDGSSSAPYASLDKAFERAGTDWNQKVQIRLAPTDTIYTTNGIFFQRNIRTWAIIDGGFGEDSEIEVVGATTVTSQSGIDIDCSGAAPGWTANVYRGLHCELRSAAGTVLGYGTIAKNTADHIFICAPKTFNLAPGDSIRIVRPKVRIQLDFETLTNASGGPSIGGAPHTEFWERCTVSLVWRNIEFVSPSGEYRTYFFTGNHAFVGVIVSGNAPGFGQNIRFTDGAIWSGKWQRTGDVMGPAIGVTREQQIGWGLSLFDPDTDIPGPMALGVGTLYQGCYVGSPPLFLGPCVCSFSDGWAIAGDLGPFVGWRYRGVLSCRMGVKFMARDFQSAANGNSFAGMGDAADTKPTIYVEEDSMCDIEIDGDLIISGAPVPFIHAEGPLILDVAGALTFENAGAHAILASGQGSIELRGQTFTALGDATIGSINPLTRAAAAWNVGDSAADAAAAFTDLPRDGAPAIYRSA